MQYPFGLDQGAEMSFSSDVPLQSNQLPISIDFPSPEHENFLDTLSLAYKRIVDSVNTKEGALYLLQEQANFERYFQYSDPTTFTPNPNAFRNGYRSVFDLVALNAGVAIPPGATNINLATAPQPQLINGILIPTHAFGAATIAGPIYVFTGTDFNVRFDNTVPAMQILNITNNTGTNLTQAYWVINYLKNN